MTSGVYERYNKTVDGDTVGIDDDKYYGYEENLYDLVLSNLKSFGINIDEQFFLWLKG